MTNACTSVVVPNSRRTIVTAHSATNPRCTSCVNSEMRARRPRGWVSVCVSTEFIVSDRPVRTVSVCYDKVQKGVSLSKASQELPRTLGALRSGSFSEARLANRSVKDEIRNNLVCKIQRGETLFPGILGYEDTVVPQVINAVLSRHNFILLGLRGQAKTRLIRPLTSLLGEWTPHVAGCRLPSSRY